MRLSTTLLFIDAFESVFLCGDRKPILLNVLEYFNTALYAFVFYSHCLPQIIAIWLYHQQREGR